MIISKLNRAQSLSSNAYQELDYYHESSDKGAKRVCGSLSSGLRAWGTTISPDITHELDPDMRPTPHYHSRAMTEAEKLRTDENGPRDLRRVPVVLFPSGRSQLFLLFRAPRSPNVSAKYLRSGTIGRVFTSFASSI